MAIFLLALAWMTAGVILLSVVYGETLLALWREPVLRRPVLIIESDDWGPGEEACALQLDRLTRLAVRHKNRLGKCPVVTLGVVLAVPDTRLMREDLQRYHRLLLSDERFSGILRAIRSGMDLGVFALQLHGMEHYWPPAVLAAASHEERIRGWLTQRAVPNTEHLPPALQSRWTDASSLPSSALSLDEIMAAVDEETTTFMEIFGQPPRVVVPPTFVWDTRVEAAWAAAGVQVVVTPGLRYGGRDHAGVLDRTGPAIYNGQSGEANLMYVVRDEYFEPSMGHGAERALEAIARKARTGRPTLFETHRFNFIGEEVAVEAAYAELERMLGLALERFPDILFLSTLELAEKMRQSDPTLIEQRKLRRLHVWLARSREISRVRKLAWFTGIIFPAWLLLQVTKPWRSPGARHVMRMA